MRYLSYILITICGLLTLAFCALLAFLGVNGDVEIGLIASVCALICGLLTWFVFHSRKVHERPATSGNVLLDETEQAPTLVKLRLGLIIQAFVVMALMTLFGVLLISEISLLLGRELDYYHNTGQWLPDYETLSIWLLLLLLVVLMFGYCVGTLVIARKKRLAAQR